MEDFSNKVEQPKNVIDRATRLLYSLPNYSLLQEEYISELKSILDKHLKPTSKGVLEEQIKLAQRAVEKLSATAEEVERKLGEIVDIPGNKQEKVQLAELKEETNRSKIKLEEVLAELDTSEKFEYEAGMRRGGEKSSRSHFVSRDAVERYARRYGIEAAEERFGKRQPEESDDELIDRLVKEHEARQKLEDNQEEVLDLDDGLIDQLVDEHKEKERPKNEPEETPSSDDEEVKNDEPVDVHFSSENNNEDASENDTESLLSIEAIKQELSNVLSDFYKAQYFRNTVFNGSVLGRLFGRSIRDRETGEKMFFKKGEEGDQNIELLETRASEALSTYQLELYKQYLAAETGEITKEKEYELAQKAFVTVQKYEFEWLNQFSTNNAEGIDGFSRVSHKLRKAWSSKTGLAARIGLGGTAAASTFFGGAAVVGSPVTTSLLVGVRAAGGLTATQAILEKRGWWSRRGLVDNYADDISYEYRDSQSRENNLKALESIAMAQVREIEEKEGTEAIQKEAARLRMLGVIRGTKIEDSAISSFVTSKRIKREALALAFIKRDLGIKFKTFNDRLKEEGTDKMAQIAQQLTGEGYEKIIDQSDQERIKRIKRNTTAAIAGTVVGIVAGTKAMAALGGAEEVPSSDFINSASSSN